MGGTLLRRFALGRRPVTSAERAGPRVRGLRRLLVTGLGSGAGLLMLLGVGASGAAGQTLLTTAAAASANTTPANCSATQGFCVNVGYADNYRANPVNFPTPWAGGANVNFQGCTPNCSFDAGAIEITNPSNSTITINRVVLKLALSTDTTPCIYNSNGTFWSDNVSLAPGAQEILTQTANGASSGCGASNGTLDSSDIGPNGGGWAGNCSQSGIIPEVDVTANGETTAEVFSDSKQVINTGGVDGASCNPKTSNESTQWTPIGSAPCPGSTLTVAPASQAAAPGAQQTVTATFTNSCSNPLAGVTVNFSDIQGPHNGQTGTGVTDANGKASFSISDSDLKQGIDWIQASISNPAGNINGNLVYMTWETATLTLKPTTGYPGTTVTFTGSGYAAGETVHVYWDSPSGTLVQTVVATSTGTISGSFVVPNPTAGALQRESVVAVGATSGNQGWAPFTSPCTDFFINPSGGNWETPSNWSSGSVPGTGDTTCVVSLGATSYTVYLSSYQTIGSLILGNTSGTSTQTLNVQAQGNGSAQLNLNANSTINKTGVFDLDSTNTSAYSMVYANTSGIMLTNNGVFNTLQTAGGQRYLRINFLNYGKANIGASDTRQDNGTLTRNDGTLGILAGGGLAVNSSSLTQEKGAISNKGSLSFNSSTFTDNGGNESGNPVWLTSSTFNDGTKAGAGVFNLQCSGNFSGNIPSTQTVNVVGTYCSTTVQLMGNVTNNGKLNVDSTSSGAYSLIYDSSGTGVLTNNGTFATVQHYGNTRYIRVNFANSPTGIVNIGAADTRFDNGTTTVDYGSFTIATGAGLSINYGSFTLDKATGATNTPTLTNNGSLSIYGDTLNLNNGTVSGNTLTINNVTLNDNGATGGSLVLFCGNTLNGAIPSNQMVNAQGNNYCSSTIYVGGAGVTNNGTLIMDSTNSGSYSQIYAGGGLTNNGAFNILQDAGGTRYINTNLTNGSGGTVTIGAADTRMQNGTATSNNGSFTVSSGGALSINYGTFANTGTLTDNGSMSIYGDTFSLNGGTFTTGNLTLNQLTLNLSSGTVSGNALVINSTLNDNGATGGSLLFTGGGNNLSGTIPSGQTVTVQGNSTYGSAWINLNSSGVTNNGTFNLDSTNSSYYSGESGGTLTNAGTANLLQDAGGTRYFRSNLSNSGTFIVGAADSRQDSNTATTNTGTFTVQDGANLALSSGSFTNGSTGTLNVAVDAIANLGYGLTGNGAISLGGTLGVNTTGTPASGSTYTVISGSTRSGTFTTVPSNYTVNYSSTGVSLTAH